MYGMLSLLLLAASPAAAPTFSEAKSAYDRNHVAEAEQLYAAVSANSAATAADRSAAERELARIAWLIDRDPARAIRHLDAARAFGDKPCDTAAMTARVLREAGRLQQALDRGDALLASCTTPDQRDTRIQLIRARLDSAAAGSPRAAALIREAAGEASKLGSDDGAEGARARLETGLAAGNAEMALKAWRDYFWLGDEDGPQAVSDEHPAARFAAALAPSASLDDRLALADLLMHAGFSEPARRFAATHHLETAGANPVWRRLQAYWQQRDRIEAALLRINRNFARGTERSDAIVASLRQVDREARTALMAAAGATGDERPALLQYYGLFGTEAGTTSGYASLHLGHATEDHRDRVTQYGHSADFRFVIVDNMIGNGFESWLWDGGAAVGGWAADGVIVQVRPAYVKAPLRAESQREDGPVRREIVARQPERAAADIARLKEHPVATLDGLRDRLQLQLTDRIEAAARSKAGPGQSVRAAFLAEYWRATLDQSIRVHEGRHAIDQALGGNPDAVTLEYQAKLSELALTAYPRMALAGLDRNLEGDGPHDKAGARIFDEFRQWVEANHAQVIGYDPALPALVQLDKLTDNQIREIARGLDPLARTEAAKAANSPNGL